MFSQNTFVAYDDEKIYTYVYSRESVTGNYYFVNTLAMCLSLKYINDIQLLNVLRNCK